ncbi:MAG: polyprenyl synthetase family protein [Campylobacterota bacterium]|nr:polyprenyl synthetase family protein [Campylobacterota bacterium]
MIEVEEHIKNMIDELSYEKASKLFSKLKGGKRLRAKLIMKIAHTHPQAPKLAAIVELIHAASLLHDDVIDEALLRRGVESVNATEGSKSAIMLGDILYSKGFSELVEFDKRIAKTIASSVTSLSIGEMQDVYMSKEFNENEQKYLDMLYLKTATLIEAAASSAAILVGKDESAYATYGKNLGLSFQIIDDILDITSDEKTLGKPALNDYVEGKCTLPYIYLYQELESSDKEYLKSLHVKQLDKDESSWILTKMSEHKCVEKSYKLAQKLSNDAINAIDDEILVGIVTSMMKRNF